MAKWKVWMSKSNLARVSILISEPTSLTISSLSAVAPPHFLVVRPPPTASHATTVRRRLQIGSLSLTSLSTSLLRSLSPCPVFQRRLTVLSAHQQTNATVFLAGHIRLCSAAVAGIVVLGMVLDILDCFWLDFIYPLDIWPKYCLTHRSFEVIKAAVRHGKRNFWTFLVSIRAPIPYGFNFDCWKLGL